MEENYIQIFCTFVAEQMEQNKLTEEDMGILIQEFAKVAENIHDRAGLLKFLHDFRDYPELTFLKQQLENPEHVFIFNNEE